MTREQAATFLYRFVTEYLEVESAESADLSMRKGRRQDLQLCQDGRCLGYR